jgi:hypothetical protein
MASAAALVSRILEETNSPTSPTFSSIVERMYEQKFTGTMVLHVLNGVPRRIEFPQSVLVDLALPWESETPKT